MSDLPDPAPVAPSSVVFADVDPAVRRGTELTRPDPEIAIPAARRTASETLAPTSASVPRTHKDTSRNPEAAEGFQKGDDAVRHARDKGNWFDQNRGWVIPVATGLGAMASSDSRYLGSALLQGLGAGAQSYGKEQSDEAGLVKQQQEAEGSRQEANQQGIKTDFMEAGQEAQVTKLQQEGRLTSEEADKVRRGAYKLTFDRRTNGLVLYDLQNPGRAPIAVPTTGAVAPGAPAPLPGGGAPVPGGGAPVPGGGAPVPGGGHEAPVAAPLIKPWKANLRVDDAVASDTWKPPENFTMTGLTDPADPGHAAAAAQIAEDKKVKADAQHRSDIANRQQQSIDLMTQEAKNLSPKGFLAPGPNAPTMMNVASIFNGWFPSADGKPAFNASQLATLEGIKKLQGSLAAQLPGGAGAEMVNQALARTPGITNSKEGFARVASSYTQALQYEKDRAAFIANYHNHFKSTENVDQLFQDMNPVKNYVRQAVIGSVPDTHLSYLEKEVRADRGKLTPEVEAWFDQKHGKGSARIILGM